MLFKANNIQAITDLIKVPPKQTQDDEINKISSYGEIKHTVWHKSKNGCEFKNILIIQIMEPDSPENIIELHVDHEYVDDLLSETLKIEELSGRTVKNISPGIFNNKRILFEGDLVYFNNRNICIYKRGQIFKSV